MAVWQGVIFRENRHLRLHLAAELRTQGGVQAPGWLLNGNPKGLQGATQGFGCKVFLEAQLRMRMDQAADLDDTFGGGVNSSYDLIPNRHVCPPPSVLGPQTSALFRYTGQATSR